MEQFVKQYREDCIGFIRFANPAGNSLPSNLLNELNKGLHSLENDSKVKVIVLESEGDRAFCGGASFSEMKMLKNLKEATAFFMGFAKVINTIRGLTKFCIARVQGKVVGGGVGLVAACDYVHAHEKAAVKLSELSIGIGPYVIAPAVIRKIGAPAFSALSMDAHDWKSAPWALEKGLYTAVHPTQSQLTKAVYQTAHRLGNYAPKAVQFLRKLHWEGTDHWEELLPKNAGITGKLALEEATQNILKKL
jgi:methylglutaconyl-CoA hydratase